MENKYKYSEAMIPSGSSEYTKANNIYDIAGNVEEWTLENGRNNLLRVNGIGGPRAFFTPIYRKICLPCSSYGEDYGMGLMISRHYRVGRVWDVMTLARRGDNNTDSNLSIEQENANNLYKDRLRTWEVQARIALNETKINN